MIVTTKSPVTLIGGGPVAQDRLRQALALAPVLVAADGGADHALGAGVRPAAVIGDMDSISADTRQKIPPHQLWHIAEQDSTDFDKCLRNIDAPAIIAVGFAGGRLDHQLAGCNALCRHPQQRSIIIAEQDLLFLAPPQLAITLAAQTRISFFPMGTVTATSTGLEWPIDGLTMTPSGQISTSNAATGPVSISVQTPNLLVILPVACLEAALSALQNAPNWDKGPSA